MKIKVVKQPAIEEEVEIPLPAFRKKDNRLAFIYEEGHVTVYKNGGGLYAYTLSGNDFYGFGTEESTKEDFLKAIERTKHIITALENTLKK